MIYLDGSRFFFDIEGCFSNLCEKVREENKNSEADEKAAELGVEKCSLKDIFEKCFVVSNHLANNEQTRGMLHGGLFIKACRDIHGSIDSCFLAGFKLSSQKVKGKTRVHLVCCCGVVRPAVMAF